MEKKIAETFYEKELPKKFRQCLVSKKVYEKSKGYDNSFNSWIDKNDI